MPSTDRARSALCLPLRSLLPLLPLLGGGAVAGVPRAEAGSTGATT